MRRYFIHMITIILTGCSRITGVDVFHFDNEVDIISKTESSGGALGDETFKIYYRYAGKKIKFFEGVNPREFHIKKINSKTLFIRFCDGTVYRAGPFGPISENIIHLDLDLACNGKYSH